MYSCLAAIFYTLCETAGLVGVDPHTYLLRALYAAIDQPGTVTLPEDLIATSTTTCLCFAGCCASSAVTG